MLLFLLSGLIFVLQYIIHSIAGVPSFANILAVICNQAVVGVSLLLLTLLISNFSLLLVSLVSAPSNIPYVPYALGACSRRLCFYSYSC